VCVPAPQSEWNENAAYLSKNSDVAQPFASYFIQALKGCGIFGRLGDSSWMRYSVDYTTEHAKNTDYLNNIVCFLATSSLLFVVIVFRILFICFCSVLRYRFNRLFYCIIFSFLSCLPLSNIGFKKQLTTL
jgi:hypothetical protein